MRRLVLWSFSIVAAFDLRLAAAAPPSTTRVPVTPSVMALAERVELNPARDRRPPSPDEPMRLVVRGVAVTSVTSFLLPHGFSSSITA